MGISVFHRRIASDIRRTGRSIVCVGAGDGTLAFAYTIGNYCHRWKPTPPGEASYMPELLVLGTFQGGFLNQLSRLMIAKGAAFDDGEKVQMLGGRYPVKMINANATARTDYAIQLSRYFQTDAVPIMQVLLPDRDGTFPDEPGCQPPFRNIPVLR